ncbi:MAG: hypothetical protein V3T03_07860, partial [Candidatus Bipolaricaulota bacterium]
VQRGRIAGSAYVSFTGDNCTGDTFQPYAYLVGTNPRAAFLARKNALGWNVLPSTRVGRLGVNAGARRAIRGPEQRLHACLFSKFIRGV